MMKKKISEKHFGDTLLRSQSLKRHSHEEIIEQFKTSIGIPDAIIVRENLLSYWIEFIQSRESLKKDSQYIRLLTVLSSSYHTTCFIIKHTGMCVKDINQYGKKLVALGLVNRRKDGALAVRSDIYIPSIEINSVEFKLTNWQSALRQALMYKTFSSTVLVVMPYDRREILQKNLKSFEIYGIGVAVFDADSEKLDVIKKPRKAPITAKYYAEAILQLYSMYS